MTAIDIQGLTKSFADHTVLNNLSLQIKEGQIFGLLGQNGAGKTTLMKIILGLLKADEGEIIVLGERAQFGNTSTNRHIGYLPDVPSFYPYMTAFEYLVLCGELAGLSSSKRKEHAEKFLHLVGLEKNNKRIGGFSRGMKQRLGIAQALIHQPKILICDEPTSALDPIGRKEILDILQKIKEQTTIIFSTHILNDAEKICDEIALLHDGQFILNGRVEDIMLSYEKPVLHVHLQNTSDSELFKQHFPDAKILLNEFVVGGDTLPTLQQKVFEVCLAEEIIIKSISIERATLEDVFLEVTAK